MITSTIHIQSPPSKVWEILLDKVFYPNKYIPGIEDYECKERATNEYVRTIITETDDVVDLVIIRPESFEIETTMVRHVFLKGKFFQRVQSQDENTSILTVESHQEITLAELQNLDMQPALDAALLQIKEMAEEV